MALAGGVGARLQVRLPPRTPAGSTTLRPASGVTVPGVLSKLFYPSSHPQAVTQPAKEPACPRDAGHCQCNPRSRPGLPRRICAPLSLSSLICSRSRPLPLPGMPAAAHALLGYERRDAGICPVVLHPAHGEALLPAAGLLAGQLHRVP